MRVPSGDWASSFMRWFSTNSCVGSGNIMEDPPWWCSAVDSQSIRRLIERRKNDVQEIFQIDVVAGFR